jgi:hypothetical protein
MVYVPISSGLKRAAVFKRAAKIGLKSKPAK